MQPLSPLRVVLLFVALAGLALVAIPRLRVELLPQEQTNQLVVRFSWPQAAPDVVEQQVTSVLEGVLAQLSEVKSIASASTYHQGRITLVFDQHADLDLKQFELTALLRQVFPRLPAGVSYPEVQRGAGGTDAQRRQGPLLVYTVAGPAAPFELKQTTATIFRKALAGTPGLREIQVTGTSDLQLHLRYNPAQMQAYGIRVDQMIAALQAHFRTTYPGAVHLAQGQTYFIQVKLRQGATDYVDLASLEELPLLGAQGQRIPLKTLATVHLEEEEPQEYFRINGQNSVNLILFARTTANALVLAQQLRAQVAQVARSLPAGYRLRLEVDHTEYLGTELHKTKRRTALSMAILALFILLAYRNWPHLLILLSALLVNLALTILAIWWLGVTIHLYTLAGLAIAFGIMIDNAIVMLDYYRQQHQRMVIVPLLGATLTTAAALLLVFLLPPAERQNLSDFALVICLALGTSLFTAFGFLPGMHDLVAGGGTLQPRERGISLSPPRRWAVRLFRAYYHLIGQTARWRKAFLLGWLLAFGLPVFLLPSHWEGRSWYNQTIGSDRYQEDLRPWVDYLLGGALRRFVREVYERYTYRDPERTRLYLQAELPHGNTPAQLDALLRRMEDYLAGVKGLEKYVTNVYSGEYGTIEITFDPAYENGALPYQLKGRLVARSLDWSGVEWSVYGVGQGFSNASGGETPSFRVKMRGYHYRDLERQAQRLRELLERHPRVQKVNTAASLSWEEKASYAYHLRLNEARLAQQGALRSELKTALEEQTLPAQPQFALPLDLAAGSRPTSQKVQLVPVYLSAQAAREFSVYELLHYPLGLDSTRRLRLQHLAELSWEKGAASIHREDRRYVRVVGFDYVGSEKFGVKYLAEQLELFRVGLPAGYVAEVEGLRGDAAQKRRQYGLMVLLLVSNYLICAVLFESLLLPLAVVLVVPLALIGLFLTFSWGNFNFDQGGYAAMVLLGGMVVNAAIFIISDYRQRLPLARIPNRALLKATVTRARTILLTVISTICGLVPFMLEGDAEVFWFALAAGSAGGLVFSLLVVFWVLPVVLWQKVKKTRMEAERGKRLVDSSQNSPI